MYLRVRGFADAEHFSRESQGLLNPHYVRVRAAEDAPRDLIRVLERRHCLAEIIECGIDVQVKRPRVSPPQREPEIMILSENASRHGYMDGACTGIPAPHEMTSPKR